MRQQERDMPDDRKDEMTEGRTYNQPVTRAPMMEHDHDEGWPEMASYKRRFEELQSQFIEEPKETVKKAEELVEEAVEKMVSSLHDRVNHIHSELGDGTDDTERLRMAMRRYRQLMDSFAENRAA